jgi:heme exporter protein D
VSFLGPHAVFIVAAYASAVVVIAAALLWVWLDYREVRRVLGELEKQGVTRRSAQSDKS